jgi:hypothetical protein
MATHAQHLIVFLPDETISLASVHPQEAKSPPPPPPPPQRAPTRPQPPSTLRLILHITSRVAFIVSVLGFMAFLYYFLM